MIKRAISTVSLLGPAFVAGIAYVDPGNITTNLLAGSKYGFLLVWVVILSTLIAAPLQYYSAKIGVITKSSIIEIITEKLSPNFKKLFLTQGLIITIATECAEFIGITLSLNLLFQVPHVIGGLIALIFTLVTLKLTQNMGDKILYVISVIGLIIIGGAFIIGIAQNPGPLAEAKTGLIPKFNGNESILLATGIIGATIMPHAIYLHSKLTSHKYSIRSKKDVQKSLFIIKSDVTLSMIFAGSVNILMLLFGACVLCNVNVEDFNIVGHDLAVRFGHGVEYSFYGAVLTSGLASSIVGGKIGENVMDSFVGNKLSNTVKRLLILVPSFILLCLPIPVVLILEYSQIFLSFGLPIALISLLYILSNKELMKDYVIGRIGQFLIGFIIVMIITINILLFI